MRHHRQRDRRRPARTSGTASRRSATAARDRARRTRRSTAARASRLPYLDELQSYDLDSPCPTSDATPTRARSCACWPRPSIAEQALGLPPVRPPGADQHRRRPGQRRRGPAHQGHARKGIALTTDGNGRYCYLDPYAGGAIAVAEAARNVVCTGAAADRRHRLPELRQPGEAGRLLPDGGGHPRHGRRLREARHAGHLRQRQPLQRDERRGRAIPTPVIGMLGLLEDVDRRCSMGFQREGHDVFLLGGGRCSAARRRRLAWREASTCGRCTAWSPAGRGSTWTWRCACSGRSCGHGERAAAPPPTTAPTAAWRWPWRSAASAAGAGLEASGLELERAPGRRALRRGAVADRRVVRRRTAGDELAELAAAHDVPLTRIGRVGGERLVLGGHIDRARRGAWLAAYRRGAAAGWSSGAASHG